MLANQSRKGCMWLHTEKMKHSLWEHQHRHLCGHTQEAASICPNQEYSNHLQFWTPACAKNKGLHLLQCHEHIYQMCHFVTTTTYTCSLFLTLVCHTNEFTIYYHVSHGQTHTCGCFHWCAEIDKNIIDLWSGGQVRVLHPVSTMGVTQACMWCQYMCRQSYYNRPLHRQK